MMDVLGEALLDYQKGDTTEDIITYLSSTHYFEEEVGTLPLPYLFRDFKDMPALEQKALTLTRGTVLDIGCGSGSHSLYLQSKGLQVTALDSSKGAIETCHLRGLTDTVHSNIIAHKDKTYNTLLLLMNGTGIAGTIKGLGILLEHLKTLLKSNGQILIDSSDIIYMFDEDEDGGHWLPAHKSYYGEVTFQMEYKGKKSAPFDWLYLDFNTLQDIAEMHHLSCELVMVGEHYDYLARICSK